MKNAEATEYPTDFQGFVKLFGTHEMNKMLEMFSNTGSDDIFRQFTQSWTELVTRSMEDPSAWFTAAADYQQAHMNLWLSVINGSSLHEPVVKPELGDRRFINDKWSTNPAYNYIKQSYLLTSKLLVEIAGKANLSPSEQNKLEFYTKQYIDALSPTNFVFSNPEVLEHAIETKGQSLVEGLKNLLGDIEKGRISMTDEEAFELGVNLASTEGAVIFQNELFQLIQYKPQGEQVYQRPTLIVPPCINKFYVLDLQPHNSFVKYCVEQGQNTFIISWINPTHEHSDIGWDDYLNKGILKAIEVVLNVSGSEKLNGVAWCVGGTMFATALAVMAKRQDDRVASATFLTSLTDFSDPGDLRVFIDDYQVKKLSDKVNSEGLLNGRQLGTTFNMLRANDLVWSYVINNYLKGQTPPPFDILHWNSDSTHLPAKMYTYYIQNMYLDNKLVQANALEICGESINLGDITIPCYFLSTIEDHIAPWKTTFNATETFGSNVEFVLAASGHIAGVINPASKNRRHYWIKGEQGKGPEQWLETAERQEGSWWTHWKAWISRRVGKKVDAPKMYGNETHPEIEPAPGSYVRVRID